MNAQVSRAHLLLALAQRPVGHLTLEHTDDQWWGYEVQPLAVADSAAQTATLNLPAPEAKLQEPTQASKGLPPPRNPLQMPEAWVAWNITEAYAPNKEAEDDTSPPLTAEELQPPDEPQVSYRDLVPLPRLLPALQRHVKHHGPGGPDIKRLLQASARRQWPTQTPRVKKSVWPHQLVLLLDCRVALYPYRFDVFRVAQAIKALLPKGQLSIYCGEHGPLGPWDEWMPGTGQGRQDRFDQLPQWRNTTCLLLGDAGLLCAQPGPRRQWQAWLQARAQAGNALVVLAPVEAHHIPGELAAVAQVLRWAPNSRFQPERGSKSELAEVGEAEQADNSALAQLLACLGAVLRMDPPLLRALRQAAGCTTNPSLEGQLWAHADVQATSYAILRQGGEGSAASTGVPDAILTALKQGAALHHAHWSLGMRLVEQMRQLDASPQGDAALLATTRQDLARLARSSRLDPGPTSSVRQTASYVLARVPPRAQAELADVLGDLAAAQGQAAVAKVPWCLVQRGDKLRIEPTSDKLNGPGVVLAGHLGFAASDEPVLLRVDGHPTQLLRLQGAGVTLHLQAARAHLVLGGEHRQLRKVRRMHGVCDWGQWGELGKDGKTHTAHHLVAHVQLPWPDGVSAIDGRFSGGHGGHWLVDLPLQSFERLLGFDGFGVYLDMRLLVSAAKTHNQQDTTRFRYLPPATFLMGSPDGVGQDDEHPQHPVTLTQALWMAETPCTQALWQAVMGQNPSGFNNGPEAPQRPVENVSWDDVQQFLAKLNALLPEGCEAVLPTEAQWEYACRAGTVTVYWWGDEPYDSKANFYTEGGKKADAERGTTPVDRHPPNPWGLRDMHGNVWEWCADGERRTYEAGTARDPMGDTGGDARVVRGGSWANHPGYARSAYRDWWHQGFRDPNLGFRFALRSSSPQGAEPQPGGLKTNQTAKEGGEAGGRSAGAGASGRATRAQPKKKGLA